MPENVAPAAPDVRVLIADDSPVAREMLKQMLESDPGIRVVGMASTGGEALALTGRLKPDLVVMDLVMPGMDGMEATQRIMARHPTPILFLSSFFDVEGSYTCTDALAAGALEVMKKPAPMPDPAWDTAALVLVQKVKTLARVPVITHIHAAHVLDRRLQRTPSDVTTRSAIDVVAIGASTGGPRVLAEILPSLPADYAPAVLVIQHMAEGFMTGLVAWLRPRCLLTLKVAEEGDILQSSRVLFAPASAHLTVVPGGRVHLSHGEPLNGCRPSVDVAFTSLAKQYGPRAAGVLLTGMGTDGAAGLLAIRQAGGVTLVQDEASCAVFGMPRAALGLGAAQHAWPPAGLIRSLHALHVEPTRPSNR